MLLSQALSLVCAPLSSAESERFSLNSSYKSLSQVEQAFRSYKTVDLQVRPIFHRKPGRVKAHIFLCMLAYYVEWHLRLALAPLIFDEDAPQQALAKRQSVVETAPRSDSAIRKIKRKKTVEELPVHSFQSILTDESYCGQESD